MKRASPDPSSCDDAAEFEVNIVDFDIKHRYVHFSYHWAMGGGDDALNVLSALLDVTDMSADDLSELRDILDEEMIIKSVVCVVNEGGGDTMEVGLTKEQRRLLEAAKWCEIPEEDIISTEPILIMSFVYIKGAY